MINAIIIDDEEHCIDRLSRLLSVHCADNIKLLGACRTVEEGVHAVNTLTPDLLFLDIHLGEQSGFDLLKKTAVSRLQIIFVTAFEQYAVSAFKFSAIDYLLKPVVKEDLLSSIAKVLKSAETNDTIRKYEALFHNLTAGPELSKKIGLSSSTGLDFVRIDDIIRCQASGNYTLFFLNNGTRITVARTLKEFEALLQEHGFFRIHHAHLVNLAYVKRYNRGSGGSVVLADDMELEVSIRRKEAFLNKMLPSGYSK